MSKLMTLAIIYNPPRLLLGMKKIGLGSGLWNGFGGKVEPGEAIDSAMRREVFEETGLTIQSYEKRGILNVRNDSDSEPVEIHLFLASQFSGVPRESDEMRPEWHNEDKLPYDHMWPDDEIWMPVFLSGKKFLGTFVLNNQKEIAESKVEIVEKL